MGRGAPTKGRSRGAPSLATSARTVLDEVPVPVGARVLVACSGGPDSQVLLDVLAHVGREGRLSLVACGVDHGLRPAAAAELDLAEALAAARQVPFERVRLALAGGSNVQARARDARWQALLAAADAHACAFVATAHHLDDRAETVLTRLLRGAPLAGLAVLPPREGRRLRPLIRRRRADLLAHATRRGLASASDPSNEDPRFLRARIRAQVLPLLAELDPRIVEHLADLADRAGDGRDRDEACLHAEIRARTGLRASARAVAALLAGAAVRLPGGRVARVEEGVQEPRRRVVILGDDEPPARAPRRAPRFADPGSRARS